MVRTPGMSTILADDSAASGWGADAFQADKGQQPTFLARRVHVFGVRLLKPTHFTIAEIIPERSEAAAVWMGKECRADAVPRFLFQSMLAQDLHKPVKG